MPSVSSFPQIFQLANLEPSSPSRAWLTAPHPTLPLLATCSSDKTVRIYSLTTFTLLSTITGGHKRSIRTCAWKPNLKGESVLATGSFDASVGIWRHYDNDMNPKPKEVLSGLDFDARDKAIANGEMGENAEEDDEEEWRFAIVLDGHESEVKSVAWSTGGNLLATCSRDKSVWIWEEVGEDDYETIAVMQEHEGDVKCVAWHPEEELLASASYDDDVRLWREDVDDWGCCGVLRGHGSTVWCVAWEGVVPEIFGDVEDGQKDPKEKWVKRREASGPRLMSCSDDLSIRVWRRRPKEKVQQSRLSIIRSGSSEENWVEEVQLPKAHSRPIYAIAWSKSGRVVSTGGDGAIVVYEERWKKGSTDPKSKKTGDQTTGVDGEQASGKPEIVGAEPMEGVTKEAETALEENEQESKETEAEELPEATDWVVVAQIEGAHGVFEVNHVAWASRRDKNVRSNVEQEEVIITTGDDGTVKVWTMDG
ncbi:MAG: Cytosolic iron-sulfur protein assembly protein [Alectoria sarmentosa]|nr:MAG: Cytosolic iron-sulfur protein assembly protein [Alectoria sarmentosa]